MPTEELLAYFADAAEDASLDHLDFERLPRHISFIMDGNGRWAQQRGLDRTKGHQAGVLSLRETVETCVKLGIEVLSVYAFSTENWKRPQAEVDMLMHLFAKTLLAELPLFAEHNVRLQFFGDIDALPRHTREVFQRGLDLTKDHTGMVFALAVNYGSRAEIANAVRRIVDDVQSGRVAPENINEEEIAKRLYTANLPDPDLIIRTSGEIRLSNYLLWQAAYSEFMVLPLYWPDINRFVILKALIDFQGRDRRFGGISTS